MKRRASNDLSQPQKTSLPPIQNNVDSLPKEIWSKIFGLTSPTTFFSLLLVSKSISSITSSSWQNLIENEYDVSIWRSFIDKEEVGNQQIIDYKNLLKKLIRLTPRLDCAAEFDLISWASKHNEKLEEFYDSKDLFLSDLECDDVEEMRFGDLVCFDEYRGVGLYVVNQKNGKLFLDKTRSEYGYCIPYYFDELFDYEYFSGNDVLSRGSFASDESDVGGVPEFVDEWTKYFYRSYENKKVGLSVSSDENKEDGLSGSSDGENKEGDGENKEGEDEKESEK